VGTFLFDLALLWIFLALGVYYVLAAGVAYAIAVTLNYLISRRVVFRGSERGVLTTYTTFMGIAAVGVFAVSGLMYLAVEGLGVQPLLSRVGVAGIVGVWNYLMNLYVNFQVAGKHVTE
jgi:putative flippase GtrA